MTPGFIALHAALPAASEDGGGGNMLLPETSDLVWGAVAFLIIAVVLIRYALPRFTKVLDERTLRMPSEPSRRPVPVLPEFALFSL